MITLGDIRTALANQIAEGIDRSVNVYDGYVPSSVQPPAILIAPNDADEFYVEFGQTYNRPLCTVHLEVTALLPPGVGADGQRVADELLSPSASNGNSVYDAIRADSTLGITGVSTVVRGLRASKSPIVFDNQQTATYFAWGRLIVDVTYFAA